MGAAGEIAGVQVVVQAVDGLEARELLDLSDAVRQKLGTAVVVLGSANDGRVHLVANVAPEVVERGVKAERWCEPRRRSSAVAAAAATRWRRPAAATPTSSPTPWQRHARGGEGTRGRSRMRVLALDHGAARCGCAISDPSGTLATPLAAIERPDTQEGAGADRASGARSVAPSESSSACRSRFAGDEGEQAGEARTFAERLARRVPVPVELHDERMTTRLAERIGGEGDADSRAAAHLLESYLARARAGTPE